MFAGYGEGERVVAEVTVLATDPRYREPTQPHRTRITLFASPARDRIVETLGVACPTQAEAAEAAEHAISALGVLGIEVI